MKAFSTLVTLILISFHLISHAQWEWQNPYPQGNSLRDVYAKGDQYCWAVGNVGTIIFSDDGGDSWTIQESGTVKRLNNIQFIDQNKGWVVGSGGTILHSTNAGYTWQDHSIDSNVCLNGLHFIDEDNGWLVGENSVILHTQDGGEYWDYQDLGGNVVLYEVFFIDELIGWVAGWDWNGQSGVIYKSVDGGANWVEQYNDDWAIPYDIFFADPDKGWIANASTPGSVLYTEDGGQNWGYQGNFSISGAGISFSDEDKGWLVGTLLTSSGPNSYVYYTENGGLSWNAQGSGSNYLHYFNGVHAANEQCVWVIGGEGFIQKSNDGESWTEISSDFDSFSYQSIHFLNSTTGWLVGGIESIYGDWERILYTSDGGTTWEAQQSVNPENMLYDVFFTDEDNGWAVGWKGAIRHTSDGGATDWQAQSSSTNKRLKGVFFTDSQNGWVAGEDGVILHTSDGGDLWGIQASSVSTDLNSIYFLNDSCGWAVGESGTILYTQNSGLSYEAQSSGTASKLNSVFFVNEYKGWAAGNGVFLYTNDGGSTWMTDVSIPSSDLMDIHFTDSLHGWVCGKIYGDYRGIVYNTDDGGNTWTDRVIHCDVKLNGIHFVDDNVGWVVGGGNILHTENGGTIDTPERPVPLISKEYFNIYPNPSSSSIKIELTEAPQKNTLVSIYNISGKIIYENIITNAITSHDISKLPAGVHIVKIWNDDGIMAQKLIKQ